MKYNELQKEIEEKLKRREKKKKPKMKVSGRRILKLKELLTRQRRRKRNTTPSHPS